MTATLSIGGNHLIHAMRRNVNLNILMFNNRIYGLTKGQYSPTSEAGKITKSSPMGSLDNPFNPVALALGAGATFVARTVDSDRKHLTEVLRAAADHPGTSFVEIYQNCPIFNDDAFALVKEPGERDNRVLRLEHGQPLKIGEDRGVVFGEYGRLTVVDLADVSEDQLVVHDAHRADPPTRSLWPNWTNPRSNTCRSACSVTWRPPPTRRPWPSRSSRPGPRRVRVT